MKRFYMKFRIMLLTLALGLASIPFFRMIHERWTAVRVDVPQVESNAPLFVTPFDRLEIETVTGGRDLSLYEFGGSYVWNCDEYKGVENRNCEAGLDKARSFVWKNWKAKKRSYIIIDEGTNRHIFIEPDKNGERHIVVRSEELRFPWGNRIGEIGIRSLEFWRDSENGKILKHGKLRLWFIDDNEGYGRFGL